MADLGFVIFEDIVKRTDGNSKIKNLALKLFGKIIELLFNAGFFQCRFGTRLYFSFRKDDLSSGLTYHEILGSMKAWVIKLPFTAETLFYLNMGYVMEYLEGFCTEKDIQECLLPQSICDKICRGGFHIHPCTFSVHQSSGKVLLKSLLIPVLKEIYTKAGMRIEHLDIVIVSGNDSEEVFNLVMLLEPYISFITIVVKDKAEIESRLSELSLDSGLSFSISSDYRNQLKHADLIINLGKPSDISRYRMSKKSLLINLYDSIESGIPGENTVLNDIVFDIAGTDVKNLIYELHKFYNKTKICEIVIANKLKLDICNKFSCEQAEYIQCELKKAGCRITGFIGRRGIISIDSAAAAIRN